MYKQPFLSIVIPVYNVRHFIVRCLDSIYNQWGVVDTEVIIVDDESPDDSIGIAREFLSDKEGYRIVSQKNKGLGGARNTGLRNALGKYVWFVDSDDEIAPQSMESIKSVGDIDDDICIFAYKVIGKDGANDVIQSTTAIRGVSGTVLCTKMIQNQAWCSLYRRDYLLKYDIFFRERFLHEDGEFNMRAITLSKKASYLPISIYKYHDDNSSSIMHNISLKNQQHLICYLDTRDTMMSKYEMNEQQKSVINKYVRGAMALFFYNACFLTSQDMKAYRNILRDNRNRILESYADFTFMEKLPIIIEAYFPWKFIYRFIFRNHV